MKKFKMYVTILITLFIDILSKVLIRNNLFLGKSVKLIKNFLYLTYVKNTGAAFSILTSRNLIISLVTLLIIAVLLYYIYKSEQNSIEEVSYGLILGGAIGNLFDRVLYGYVTDFIDIYIFKYNYPVFNIADSCIVIGAIILIISMYRREKNGIKSSIKRKS